MGRVFAVFSRLLSRYVHDTSSISPICLCYIYHCFICLHMQAAGQYNKVEEAIFETLSEIPEILQSSRRYIGIYADLQNQSLEEKTFYLFRSILRTLTHIMKFFSDSKIREHNPFFISRPTSLIDTNRQTLRAHIETIII